MTNRAIKVHLFGSENKGWALDTDFALTRQSLLDISDLIELTSFHEADVIHSVWEEPLFEVDQEELVGKRVICHACNNIMRLHENPMMIQSEDTVGLWVAMSQKAVRDMEALGYPSIFIPYSVDINVFKSSHQPDEATNKIRQRYKIPENKFIVSNFMRDTCGHDLETPKEQKGVELLLEIGVCLKEIGIPVHYLLAGPRRHWIRKKLQQFDIPYTFVGNKIAGDDLQKNILTANVINELYIASDVHLISSRWEGGPRSVLEAAATKTPVLSTPVGIAPDILERQSLYESLDEGVKKLESHYHEKILSEVTDKQYQIIRTKHTASSNAMLFRNLYNGISEIKPYLSTSRWIAQPSPQPTYKPRILKIIRGVIGKPQRKKPLCISLWHEFHKPPYGGGNQFMMALKEAMERKGVEVVTNKLLSTVDVHICNSCWFDVKKFEKKAHEFPVRIIHRIDGPVTLYRGEGRLVDEQIFSINKQFASATVFQSAYCFRKSYELGFRAVSPVIIHNGVNSSIFNQSNREIRQNKRKIKLITSAWSDNPRKGGAFLKWLDGHLDWNRYEYTFVGRVKESFENIHHIPAVPSEDLAEILRQHDIYVSVSQHEPCSNALLEALSCGLPALYRNDGGNPELVSFGGLPFTDEKDVLGQLSRMVTYYDSFQKLIQVRTMEDIANRYIKLAERICAWEA